ncbi:MAG: hypothetical protein R2688_00130 [Fimbriimonadaceae bacterium]
MLHTFCASLSTTPQGALKKTPSDPANFDVTPVDLSYIIEKSNFKKVFFKETRHYTYRNTVICQSSAPMSS